MRGKVHYQTGWWPVLTLLTLALAACGEATVTPVPAATTVAIVTTATAPTTVPASVAPVSGPATTAALTTVVAGSASPAVTTATTAATGTAATTAAQAAPAQPAAKVVQPKVNRTAQDARRVIEFTEQPDLKDGAPSFVKFDAVG